jgi:Flp pilus assembly pilin Flp
MRNEMRLRKMASLTMQQAQEPVMRTSRPTRGTARFVGQQAGATLMEYALIGALVSVVIVIAVLAVMGGKT